MLNIVNSCIGTGTPAASGPLMAELALDAVNCVAVARPDGEGRRN
jgi:T-complex protein 1 subunit gamma